MEEDKNRQSPGPQVAVFGTSLALGSAVIVLAGYWMDHRAGGGFKRTLVALLLALLYIGYETWKFTKQLNVPPPKDDHSGEGQSTPRPPPAP